jgi:hypothetical protein
MCIFGVYYCYYYSNKTAAILLLLYIRLLPSHVDLGFIFVTPSITKYKRISIIYSYSIQTIDGNCNTSHLLITRYLIENSFLIASCFSCNKINPAAATILATILQKIIAEVCKPSMGQESAQTGFLLMGL